MNGISEKLKVTTEVQKRITRSIGFYKQHSQNAHTLTKQKKKQKKKQKDKQNKAKRKKQRNKEKVHYTTKF